MMKSGAFAKMAIVLSALVEMNACSGIPLQIPTSPPAPGTTGSAPALQADAMARDVFERINSRRASVGLAPLAWDATLSYLATEHSAEMAAGRRPFGHDGFEARMAAARSAMAVSRGSENVGRNTYPPSQVVGVAVSGWIESPGHRQNLEGSYTATGVGVARAADGEYFLTQLFVAP
jgi:uncharacterized protein YkwD